MFYFCVMNLCFCVINSIHNIPISTRCLVNVITQLFDQSLSIQVEVDSTKTDRTLIVSTQLTNQLERQTYS